jgi:DNA-binding response OmpR family regulator
MMLGMIAKRCRILVVEDHKPTAETLSRMLRRRGYDVSLAQSFVEALEAGRRHYYDILLSDLGLPDGDGWELLPELHAVQPMMKAIAVSGRGSDEDIRRSIAAGYYLHLTKPVSFAELDAAILSLLPEFEVHLTELSHEELATKAYHVREESERLREACKTYRDRKATVYVNPASRLARASR